MDNAKIILASVCCLLLVLGVVCQGTAKPTKVTMPQQIDKEAEYVKYLHDRLALHAPGTVEFQVSLRDSLSPTDFEHLLEGKNLLLDFFMIKIPQPGSDERSKIDAKKRPFSKVVFMEGMKDLADYLAANDSDDIATVIRTAASDADNNVKIWAFRGKGDASDIRDWWAAHPQQVRFVQLIENDLDKIQRTWEPGEPI